MVNLHEAFYEQLQGQNLQDQFETTMSQVVPALQAQLKRLPFSFHVCSYEAPLQITNSSPLMQSEKSSRAAINHCLESLLPFMEILQIDELGEDPPAVTEEDLHEAYSKALSVDLVDSNDSEDSEDIDQFGNVAKTSRAETSSSRANGTPAVSKLPLSRENLFVSLELQIPVSSEAPANAADTPLDRIRVIRGYCDYFVACISGLPTRTRHPVVKGTSELHRRH